MLSCFFQCVCNTIENYADQYAQSRTTLPNMHNKELCSPICTIQNHAFQYAQSRTILPNYTIQNYASQYIKSRIMFANMHNPTLSRPINCQYWMSFVLRFWFQCLNLDNFFCLGRVARNAFLRFKLQIRHAWEHCIFATVTMHEAWQFTFFCLPLEIW